mmetsp:Transcript_34162/g.58405  ORF Transcript_34162/g.58405 Transcript_34162/m.58405 type:complete len:200 (-) Transcript_34162:247-846(-)
MEKLIARERAAAVVPQAGPKQGPRSGSSAADLLAQATGAKGKSAVRKKKRTRPEEVDPVGAAAEREEDFESGVLDGMYDLDEDDEEDEELAANGSFVPSQVADPATAAAAKAEVDRRVFLDGMEKRKSLNGGTASIVRWVAERKMWEVEMDRGDERVLVRSANLRRLDQAPPPRQAAASTKGSKKPSKAGGKTKKARPA